MTTHRRIPKKTQPKIKRLSLWPQTPAKNYKVGKRWVVTREKPEMKAPERVPNYRDLRPQYSPAVNTAPAEAATQETAGSILAAIFGILFFFLILFILATEGVFDVFFDDTFDGGPSLGETRNCITRATGGAFGDSPRKPSCSDTSERLLPTQVNANFLSGGDPIPYSQVPCYKGGTAYRC